MIVPSRLLHPLVSEPAGQYTLTTLVVLDSSDQKYRCQIICLWDDTFLRLTKYVHQFAIQQDPLTLNRATILVMRLFRIGLTFQHFELSNFHLAGQSYLLVPSGSLLLVPHLILVRIPKGRSVFDNINYKSNPPTLVYEQ